MTSAPAKARPSMADRATVNAADFAAALGAVLYAVARDSVRWGLNGVDVVLVGNPGEDVAPDDEEWRLQFTATDGHRLARTTVPIESRSAGLLQRDELLSLDGATALVAAAKKAGALPLDLVRASGSDFGNDLLLYLGDAALAAGEVIGGEFPDCDAVIRTSTASRPQVHKCTVTVDRRALLKALADVQAPARDRAKAAYAVRKTALDEARATRKAASAPLREVLDRARAAQKAAVADAKASGERGAVTVARNASKSAIDVTRAALVRAKNVHDEIVAAATADLDAAREIRDVTVVALRLDNADVGRLTVEVPARPAVWCALDEEPPTVDGRAVEAHATVEAAIDWDDRAIENGVGFNLVYLRDALAHAKCAAAARIEIGIEGALAPVHIEPVAAAAGEGADGADAAVTYLGVVMPTRLA